MDSIRFFFEVNRSLLYFVYGLSFFILGLATALQSRQYSRLDLARALKWLAAFGLIHGLHEWGDVFIPVQEEYVSTFTSRTLHRIHLISLGVSFACLMEFGVALLGTVGGKDWLHIIPAALLAVWFFVGFFPLADVYEEFMVWHDVTNALARYFIGFPGSFLVAYSLRKHSFQRIRKLNVPDIFNMLRNAGIGFLLYGLFSGLIPPPIPFFPGNVINTQSVMEALILPVPVFRALIGFGLTISVIRALEIFDVEIERMIEEMEEEQIRAAERSRLSRELHDGVIQKVYTAGLMVESAHRISESEESALAGRLKSAETVLKDALEDLRSNLIELYHPVREIQVREALQELVGDPRFQSFVDIDLEVNLPSDSSLSPVRGDHLLAIINESLNNIIRHAQATQVEITAEVVEDQLHLRVKDNGVGIPEDVEAGYGLRNMRDRARMLGGTVRVRGAESGGTEVVVDIPWEDTT
ncbi:MAG: sensor histidine kinase [Anaerolineales bacterium]